MSVEMNATTSYSSETSKPIIARRRRPEVLAPAGNMTAFKAAVDFGADSLLCELATLGKDVRHEVGAAQFHARRAA